MQGVQYSENMLGIDAPGYTDATVVGYTLSLTRGDDTTTNLILPGPTGDQWSTTPAITNVNMNTSSIYGVKQISNSAVGGLVLSGTDNFADTNHRITVATSGISINSVNLTGNVSVNGGNNTTIAANTNVSQTNGVLTLQNKTNSAYLTSSGFGLNSLNPTAKFEIVQDAAADCMRVYDSNADTTFFKIDSNGNVGINTGANATATKTLNIGYGGSDSNSALKFNSGANDKIFWTFYDTGPKTSILNDFVLQTDLGSLGHPNYGSEIWRTMGPTDYIERMRLTNAGNLGIGTSTPTAKLEVLQELGADSVRVLDSNADTTFFKIDSNGFVGVNCGASALTKAFNIGYGVSDTGSNTSALKFNSADGDKLFLTYLDGGSKISQLSNWGFGLSAGHVSTINQGFFTFRTMGGTLGAEPVERMRLENNGQLNVMSNKIINVATPTTATDAVNKSYVDAVTPSNWAAYTASQAPNIGGYKIQNVANPSLSSDVANKQYVDGAISAAGIATQVYFHSAVTFSVTYNSLGGNQDLYGVLKPDNTGYYVDLNPLPVSGVLWDVGRIINISLDPTTNSSYVLELRQNGVKQCDLQIGTGCSAVTFKIAYVDDALTDLGYVRIS